MQQASIIVHFEKEAGKRALGKIIIMRDATGSTTVPAALRL